MENQISVGDQNTQQSGQRPIIQPVKVTEKAKINYMMIGGVIFTCLIIFGFCGFYLGRQSPSVKKENVVQNQPTPSSATTQDDPTRNWKSYTFQPIQLSLKVPSELTVHTEEQNPGSFTAYIQNYAFNAPYPEKNAYQLYLTWQSNYKLTENEFNQLKNDLDTNSVEDTLIAGYPAIKGQVKGERSRFVTYILKENTKISLFTSDPTEVNKELSDKIMSTFVFNSTKTATCDTDKTYTQPVSCSCPNDYSFKIVEMKWGQCPKEGMRDCPVSVVQCTKDETSESTGNITTPPPTVKPVYIKPLDTSDWKTVSNNGISFKIPAYATCNDSSQCNKVSWTFDYQGHSIPTHIDIEVQNYLGGSRRDQYFSYEPSSKDCKPIYQESLFGKVNALEVAVDGGWCQGGYDGGIVVVVGNKLVILGPGQFYNEQKTIQRWDIRDTLISTLSI